MRVPLKAALALAALLTAATAAAAGPSRPARLRVLAGGDVTLGHHLPELFEALRAEGWEEPALRRYPFEKLAGLIGRADLFWVNLEGTLTTAGQATAKNFTFRADPGEVALLNEAGVDVVSLANNHAFDFGPEGLAQTLATLDGAGIAHYGAGATLAEARRPAIVERGGLRVGFLGYLFLGDHSIEPPVIYAGPKKAGVAGTYGDLETLLGWVGRDVAALRPRVDLLLVSFHWGREGRNRSEPYQRLLAQKAIRAGADAVVGHHPHVLQGTERIGQSPVAYSLGNLVFAGNWNPRRKEAALLELTFLPATAASKKTLKTTWHPLSIDRQPERPFQPYPLEGKQADRVRRLVACYASAQEEGGCEEQVGGLPVGAGAGATGPEPARRCASEEATGAFREGFAAQRRLRSAQALRAYRRCLSLDPGCVACQYEIGWSHWSQRHWAQAAAAWEKTLELDREHFEARRWLPKAKKRAAMR